MEQNQQQAPTAAAQPPSSFSCNDCGRTFQNLNGVQAHIKDVPSTSRRAVAGVIGVSIPADSLRTTRKRLVIRLLAGLETSVTYDTTLIEFKVDSLDVRINDIKRTFQNLNGVQAHIKDVPSTSRRAVAGVIGVSIPADSLRTTRKRLVIRLLAGLETSVTYDTTLLEFEVDSLDVRINDIKSSKPFAKIVAENNLWRTNRC